MYKPRLYDIESRSEMISEFGGVINKTVIPENCFRNQLNLSLSKYPALSVRPKRAFFDSAKGYFYGLFSKEKLCYIRDGYLYIGGEKIPEPYFGNSSDERIFVSMGARLVIFPDKVYINTRDYSDYGYLEATFSSTGAVCRLCKPGGEPYEDYLTSSAEPEDKENGDLWLDTSSEVPVLKQYSEGLGIWVEVSGVRVNITCPGLGNQFEKGDGVTLEGFEKAGLEGDYVIKDIGEDFITVTGTVASAITITDEFTVSRRVPDMDFVCESNNRLWGCSSERNEIYASKLGDPTNFYVYEGISTDSFTFTVGTDGQFTACTPYRGYILFFKENCVHKVYGQNPPYTATTSFIRGVQVSSSKSLVCLNETLYYKSPTGVCAYEGGVPVEIGSDLGEGRFSRGVGGAIGNRYYLCMTDGMGARRLYCYHEDKAMWCIEDEIDISAFAVNNSNLYFVERRDDYHRLGLVDSENMYGSFKGELKGFSTEDELSWSFRTGLWGLGLPYNKYYTSFTVRAVGEEDSEIDVFYDVDSRGNYTHCFSKKLSETGSFNIHINAPRCDHIELVFSGKGNVIIFSVMRDVGIGSDVYV